MISWKELDANPDSILKLNNELRKKSSVIYKDQDPSNFKEDEVAKEDDEISQEDYKKYCSNLFSQVDDLVDESIFFFASNIQLINIDIFKQLLILTNIFHVNPELKDIQKTEMNLLIAIGKSIKEDEFCDFFFEKGYYENIISIIRITEDPELIKFSLNIFTSISNTSIQQAQNLFQNGILDALEEFLVILMKSPDTENWPQEHRIIFEGLFNLLISFLHYPSLFIDKDLLRIRFLCNIYKNINQYILEDFYGKINVFEISLALKFIRRIFMYIEPIGLILEKISPDSKEYLIKSFNETKIFDWIIQLFCPEEIADEYVHMHASKAIIAISSSYEEFSAALLHNSHFYNFMSNINEKMQLSENFTFYICRILRNFSACDMPIILNSIFLNDNVLDFIKVHIDSVFSIKFEVFYTYFNLILFFHYEKPKCLFKLKTVIHNFLSSNLKILPYLVDVIQYNDDKFLQAALESIIAILYMGEKGGQENIFIKAFDEAGLFQSLDMIDEAEKISDIVTDINEIRRLMAEGKHFNEIAKDEDEDVF